MPLQDFIITVYCLIDEMLKLVVHKKIRQRGFEPRLSDSEITTMEIVAKFWELI